MNLLLLCCAQLCLTLCDPVDCSSLVSSVHGISQARRLEWVAISFSRASSQPRDWTASPAPPALQVNSLSAKPTARPFLLHSFKKYSRGVPHAMCLVGGCLQGSFWSVVSGRVWGLDWPPVSASRGPARWPWMTGHWPFTFFIYKNEGYCEN